MPLTSGLGQHFAGLVLPGTLLIPVIVHLGVHQSEEVLLRALFASVFACGTATALQTPRPWRFGSGHLIPTGRWLH